MSVLAGIIFGAVYVEHWNYRRIQKNEEIGTRRKILVLIKNDLDRKLRFVDESIQYKDYKPFFTDIWDAVILSGKQTLLTFEMIENLQHTYSWLKYYNTELLQKTVIGNENTLKGLLEEVKKSINNSLNFLNNEKN
jgi:predicted O-linked N-acetylglucosamine transferase (SPINDLY family)